MPGPSYVTVSRARGARRHTASIMDARRDDVRRVRRTGADRGRVGLHGVIGYNVAQRMHELGVRIALGRARRHRAVVVTQAVTFVTIGLTIGLGVAWLAARWVQPLLFGESARDPVVFIGVGLAVSLVSVVASAGPALRATRADPTSALREA